MVLARLKKLLLCHLLLGYVFVVSGLIVNFLQLCCLLIIWPFSKNLYRRLISHLCYLHWSQLVFLAEWWSGSDCEVVSPNPDDHEHYGKEHGIVVLNHSYEIDWLMGWILCERFGTLGSSKIYGKKILKFVPIIGWAWVFAEVIFLERDWNKDRQAILKAMNTLGNFPIPIWILLFCEGTRFTPAKHKASLEYARANGLPELKHHLLPRTKGFVLSIQGFKGKIQVIYDAVVGFDQDGGKPPSLMNVVNGVPAKAQMFVRRIPLEEIPTGTEQECSDWLIKLYEEKDKLFEHFLKEGTFPGYRFKVPRSCRSLIVECVWSALLLPPLFYYLGRLVMSGSIYLYIAILVVAVLISFGVTKMIKLTQVQHGSAYGKDTKSL